MVTSREELTARSTPSIILSTGDASSLTAAPTAMDRALTAEQRAVARFSIDGAAIGKHVKQIKTVLLNLSAVTGGAGTLGLACVRALLEHGASGVCIWDLEAVLRASLSAITSLAREFAPRRVFGIGVDITDDTSVKEALVSTVPQIGNISHLFCFAGIVDTSPALGMSDVNLRRVMDVNFTGTFLCAQAVASHMAALPVPNRSITMIASVSGHRVNYPQPQVGYNASKAAVLSMKASLAAEWAHLGIRVNSISPGYMDTILNEGEGLAEARRLWMSRNPMGRMGAVGELDGVCVLLASRAGTYINGADIVIDGGQNLLF